MPNTSFPNYLYWLNKPLRLITSYLHPNNPTINKSRNSNSTMSRNSFPRISPQNKKHISPFPTARNTYSSYSYTHYYWNNQPIYSTHSPCSSTNSQYYCRTFTHTSYRRGNPSFNLYQSPNSYNYIYHSCTPNYSRICCCPNSSICVYSTSKLISTW